MFQFLLTSQSQSEDREDEESSPVREGDSVQILDLDGDNLDDVLRFPDHRISMKPLKSSPKISLRSPQSSTMPLGIGGEPARKKAKIPPPARRAAVAAPMISNDGDQQENPQARFNRLVQSGENVLLTGGAGTGKSFLLDSLRYVLRGKNVALTGLTGVASLLIGGRTLHSWGSIRPGLLDNHVELYNLIHEKDLALTRWLETDVLVIDECSMMGQKLLSAVDFLGRTIRKRSKTPFGGLQLILVGDFAQLPPIGDKQYCFEHRSWSELIPNTVELIKVWRQAGDARFIDALSEVRLGGRISSFTCNLLNERCGRESELQKLSELGIEPTILLATRKLIDAENNRKLDQLPGKGKRFIAQTVGSNPDLLKNCPAPEILKLKIGAQCVLLKNIDVGNGLCNGSRCVVVGWDDTRSRRGKSYPVVKFVNGSTSTIDPEEWMIKGASRRQIPLALAWTLTIHRSQGLSLDCVSLSLSKCFAVGQAYVALSRVRTRSSLFLAEKFDPRKVKTSPKVQQFYRALKNDQENISTG